MFAQLKWCFFYSVTVLGYACVFFAPKWMLFYVLSASSRLQDPTFLFQSCQCAGLNYRQLLWRKKNCSCTFMVELSVTSHDPHHQVEFNHFWWNYRFLNSCCPCLSKSWTSAFWWQLDKLYLLIKIMWCVQKLQSGYIFVNPCNTTENFTSFLPLNGWFCKQLFPM